MQDVGRNCRRHASSLCSESLQALFAEPASEDTFVSAGSLCAVRQIDTICSHLGDRKASDVMTIDSA